MVVLVLFSCRISNTKVANEITVDFNTSGGPDYYVKEIIPLDIDTAAIIGRNFKLRITPKYYIVGDATKIVVFHKNGKIKNVIAPIGKSSEEVTRITYFTANEECIEIFDGLRSRLVKYSFDGDFMGFTKIAQQTGEYVRYNDMLVFDNQTSNPGISHALSFYDEYGSKLSDTINIRAKGLNYGAGSKFQFDNERLFYLPSFYNTIYEIKNGGSLIPAYTLNFKDRWADEKECDQYASYDNVFALWDYMKNNGKVGFVKFLKNNDWLVLSFELKDQSYIWFYNEQTKQQHILSQLDENIIYNTIACDDGSFVAMYDAAHYKQQFDKGELAIDENDNPVIVIYDLQHKVI